mmetsp:Transcript_24502/g.40839  ORF Transcript_24502/g.40839 Transcript_24502/m.40839 type:complete len:626 (-) Transcript_24502:748-2625(-)
MLSTSLRRKASDDEESQLSNTTQTQLDDEESNKMNKTRNLHDRLWRFIRSFLCLSSFLFFLWIITNLARSVIPEIDLVLNSRCEHPFRGWDGKLFNIPIWYNSYLDRPSYINFHLEEDYEGNNTNFAISDVKNMSNRPIIIFATHHKTGTFLAKKLFSKICSKMQWCCSFHATRDSIHGVAYELEQEPITAMGHNQWIWNPNVLGTHDYRFVHFYRHPYKKIVSGYHYHMGGEEGWTVRPLTFNHLCRTTLLHQQQQANSSSRGSSGLTTSAVAGAGIGAGAAPVISAVDRSVVWEFCEAVHLCENCCRLEHERLVPIQPTGTTLSSSNNKADNHSSGNSDSSNGQKYEQEQNQKLQVKVQTFRRPQAEYEFLCRQLGHGAEIMKLAKVLHGGRGQHMHSHHQHFSNGTSSTSKMRTPTDSDASSDIYSTSSSSSSSMSPPQHPTLSEAVATAEREAAAAAAATGGSKEVPSSTGNPTLQQMLLALPAEEAVLVEAGLAYYENLRMATIIHETSQDPLKRILNIDIDDLNNNFADVTLQLLQHLVGENFIPAAKVSELHKDLSFYDLQTSPVYRWSMSNPLVNHITSTNTNSNSNSRSSSGSRGSYDRPNSVTTGTTGTTTTSCG